MYAHGFVYVFRDVQIVVYDVGECHMSVVIDPERDRLSLQLCINIVVFLVYFWGNIQNIITGKHKGSPVSCKWHEWESRSDSDIAGWLLSKVSKKHRDAIMQLPSS